MRWWVVYVVMVWRWLARWLTRRPQSEEQQPIPAETTPHEDLARSLLGQPRAQAFREMLRVLPDVYEAQSAIAIWDRLTVERDEQRIREFYATEPPADDHSERISDEKQPAPLATEASVPQYDGPYGVGYACDDDDPDTPAIPLCWPSDVGRKEGGMRDMLLQRCRQILKDPNRSEQERYEALLVLDHYAKQKPR